MADGGEAAEHARALAEPVADEPPDLLLQHLHTSRRGLSAREAARRLVQYGPNELRRHGGRRWPRELARQVTHPLALLLWLAAALSYAVGSHTVAVAVLLVIALNALFAFVQELQAERAVEALARYLPPHAMVVRDGVAALIDATGLVPGDIVVLEEGDRVAADVRLLDGAVDVDMSTLTGESVPVLRAAELTDLRAHRLDAPDLVFSGSNCTGGQARGVVFATGMHTQLGRIAALSQRLKERPSPLEAQVRRVAWLIALIAVGMAIAFVPVAVFGAGLSIRNSVVFAVGLLAGNVPEGLLPVITLALAVAVSALARRGALVKRLSAVETLGATDVICADKTGTLTENRMRPMTAWTTTSQADLRHGAPATEPDAALAALAATAASCNNATIDADRPASGGVGDPTEIALLLGAHLLGAGIDPDARKLRRRHAYEFDPQLKLMSTLDVGDASCDWLHTKGAPESVLPRCDTRLASDGEQVVLADGERTGIAAQIEAFAARGLRVLALARRAMPAGERPPPREEGERELCFLGLVTMLDPPRAGAAEAVARCHTAGIRIIVITGDHPLTAAAIARQVGIGGDHPTVINAQALGHAHEKSLATVLAGHRELVFARSSPEAKLHIADALRAEGHVVAMTGDGVNDAPALRSADIGVAMGRSGTDVAREASTMVLTDDSFASIVAAIEAGRQVYDNVRKFIVYIFAHATPEVVPFLVFALAGGAVPLPLTVLQLLAFDVGTETLPSLALSREPMEPGTMDRPPRPHGEPVIRRPMLVRAWLFLGMIVAALQMAGFFYVLTTAGWHPGAPVGPGAPLHHAYRQATTMSFLGMIAGQVGTAFAVRTQRASLRSIGVFSNPYLLAAVVAELLLAAVCVYASPLQSLLGTAALPAHDLLLLLPYPVIVWSADEARRWLQRRRAPNP